MKTRNALVTENDIEHAEVIKYGVGVLIKINFVRKCKGGMLPCELVGSNDTQLTLCVKK